MTPSIPFVGLPPEALHGLDARARDEVFGPTRSAHTLSRAERDALRPLCGPRLAAVDGHAHDGDTGVDIR